MHGLYGFQFKNPKKTVIFCIIDLYIIYYKLYNLINNIFNENLL